MSGAPHVVTVEGVEWVATTYLHRCDGRLVMVYQSDPGWALIVGVDLEATQYFDTAEDAMRAYAKAVKP